MNTTTFDTLTAARSLEGAGIEPKQAEAIVAAIRSSRSEIITKGDLSTAVAKRAQWPGTAPGANGRRAGHSSRGRPARAMMEEKYPEDATEL